MSSIENKYTRLGSCPICYSKAFHKKMEIQDFSISHEHFNLEICASCSLVVTNPYPKLENLSAYYASEEYISHSGTKKGIINKLYHLIQKHNLNLKYRSFYKTVPRGTWMDYGAGNGAFLQFLKAKNIKAIGYEPDKGARKMGVDLGLTVNDSAEYKASQGKYAAVTMWHVLEHVPDLNELLKKHYSNLKDDGILIIAVPNHLSYDACYYKNYWAAYDVPRHLWHFTQNDILSLTKKHGFEYLKTKPMIFDSYYVSMLSEKYKKGSVIRGIAIGALSNIYARFSGYPFSSQIYIFRKKAI